VFASILTNSLMIAFISNVLEIDGNYEKLIVAFTIEHTLLLIKLGLAALVPDTPTWVFATSRFQQHIFNDNHFDGVKGVTNLTRQVQSALKRYTPREMTKSSTRSARRVMRSMRTNRNTAGRYPGSAVTAGYNELDPEWDKAAGITETVHDEHAKHVASQLRHL